MQTSLEELYNIHWVTMHISNRAPSFLGDISSLKKPPRFFDIFTYHVLLLLLQISCYVFFFVLQGYF
ncbi:hypothetical protein FKM82_004461 [Ascaphus truei]